MPGHARIGLRDRPTPRDPFESLGEPDVRIDVIHLRGLQKRGDDRPGPTAATAAREERFFLVMVCGRIARSTVLESISMRPSLRKRSRATRLDVA